MDGASDQAHEFSAEHEETKDQEAPHEEAPDEQARHDGQADGKRRADEDTADAEPRDAEAAEDAGAAEEEEEEEAPPVTELLVQLGHDVSVLVFCETQLAASRHLPVVRRAARDITGALIAALGFLTAFVFANVAALAGLRTVVSSWLAPLLLCGAWLALGSLLALALMVRAGNVTGWKWWRVFRAGKEESLDDLVRARGDAEERVRDTLAQLAPAVSVEIASASAAVAGDMAGDVVEGMGDMLEASDDVVEAIAEEIPGGSIVNQMWDVVLVPGRFGVKVATTVLRRGNSTTER